MEIIKKIKTWYKNLPEQKKYIEFLTAILTIPVLLTIIVNNVNMMRNSKTVTSTPSYSIQPQVITIVQKDANPSVFPPPTISLYPTPTQYSCNPQIGPVNINHPMEGEIVNQTPVCLDILYDNKTYCPVVWSYKLNNGD